MNPTEHKRLLSLDVLRGATIAGMIMVNHAGNWGSVYAPLRHAAWDGLTPADLVFPFFMFIMGISTFISLQKYNFQFNKEILVKITKRTLIIFLIGLIIAWIGLCFRTYRSLGKEEIDWGNRLLRSLTNLSNLRIPGVLQRLAITYCITSFIAIWVKHKYIPHIIITTLAGYFLLILFGHGTIYGEKNIIAIADQIILGSNHMLSNAFDPEGMLSTISALCNVLIGFICGKLIMEADNSHQRILRLFIVSATLTFSGFLLSYGCPINKKIWSSTFVLVTCGMGSGLLALMSWGIDVKGHKKWCRFLESFGANPLFIYVFAEILAILLSNISFPHNGKMITVKGFINRIILEPYLGDYLGSFAYSLLFVFIAWIIGNILHRNRIYIKI